MTVLSTPCLALAFAAPASADVAHTVAPGDTLWSIAAANNLTTRTVAAFNGLSADSNVVLGGTVRVPTAAEGAAALQASGSGAATGSAATGASSGSSASSGTGASHSAPSVQGAYTVRPGDTLSELAANAGVSLTAMAAMNGLNPDGLLISGTPIKLPSGAAAPARAAQPAPATHTPKASPHPSSTRVGAADIQAVASRYGVSPSLAAAIAWQESGFNNSMVSSANARGVMQVMPGTWDYVQKNLADRPLDSNSATDNVHAGVLYLRRLLRDAGGDENAAIAGYYQGLGSVRSRGLYDDTRRYIDNVQALRARFRG